MLFPATALMLFEGEATVSIESVLTQITTGLSGVVPNILSAIGAAGVAGIGIAGLFIGVRGAIRMFKTVGK